jgi:hypothetical protein
MAGCGVLSGREGQARARVYVWILPGAEVRPLGVAQDQALAMHTAASDGLARRKASGCARAQRPFPRGSSEPWGVTLHSGSTQEQLGISVSGFELDSSAKLDQSPRYSAGTSTNLRFRSGRRGPEDGMQNRQGRLARVPRIDCGSHKRVKTQVLTACQPRPSRPGANR